MLPTVEGVSGDAGALQQGPDRDVVLAQGNRRTPGGKARYRRQGLLLCLGHVDADPTNTSPIWQGSAGISKRLVAHGRRDDAVASAQPLTAISRQGQRSPSPRPGT